MAGGDGEVRFLSMPAYDYLCRGCGRRFEIRMSMAAYAEGRQPACPDCGSPETERTFTAVNVLTTGRGTAGGGARAGCGSGGFT